MLLLLQLLLRGTAAASHAVLRLLLQVLLRHTAALRVTAIGIYLALRPLGRLPLAAVFTRVSLHAP